MATETIALSNREPLAAMLQQPESVQADCLLRRIVQPNSDCEFGRSHDFDSIQSVRDFRRAVPLNDYESLRGRIDRMAAGEHGVLVSSPVRHFFVTSGSTTAPKYIPVTSAFMRDKLRGFGIYWQSLYERHPGLGQGLVAANISDSGDVSRTPTGIPYSSESAFWSRMTAATRGQSHFVAPRSLASIEDWDSRYYVLARLLLEEDLTAFMSLNPSTLLLLFQTIDRCAESLIGDLEQGGLSASCLVPSAVRADVLDRCQARPDRARAMRKALRDDAPRLRATDVWPDLKLIISWRSPVQQPYLDLLEGYVASVPHDDYITMASEGIIAIPLEGQASGGVLATGIHFYEFIPAAQAGDKAPDVLLAHELEEQHEYVVVLSTSGGLYRYNIGDVVRVKGFMGATPLVEFLYRAGATCSLTGEKLTEAQVSEAITTTAAVQRLEVTAFTMCPASEGFPHYVVLVEFAVRPTAAEAKAFLAAVDRELGRHNIEYHAKRDSRRLGAPELWVVEPLGYQTWRRRRIASGSNAEQIKPTPLSRDPRFPLQLEVAERVHADQLH